ncbi:AmmeMemoRadiSam system protein B [bacterium]|nr:AmmeMemoRadiSam system protein B [bacterium]
MVRWNGIALLIILLGMPLTACSAEQEKPRVREAVVAGKFYSDDADELKKIVDDYLTQGVGKLGVTGRPLALVAPHAGYAYSGRCAGVVYAHVKGKSYQRVVILAVNHSGQSYRGVSIPKVDAYRTPLGDVPLDTAACTKLLAGTLFGTYPSAHSREHSLEVQLPFLQRALGAFQLVPIIVGALSRDDMKTVAKEIRPVLDNDTLLVVSSDFTHYGRNYRYIPFRLDIREKIEKLDKGAIAHILKPDNDAFWAYLTKTKATVCGRYPISLLNELLPFGAQGVLVDYYTSGDAKKKYDLSVSYAGIVFSADGHWGKAPTAAKQPTAGVSPAGQKKLLDLARKTLVAITTGHDVPDTTFDDPELQVTQGVFVTLHKKGQLRGCIGNFKPDTPLYRTVTAQTQMSAFQDRRFKRVSVSEAKDIDIEITVLLPYRVIQNPLDWEFGKHGIIVRQGRRQATYLPQVAEHFKTKEEMLSACCRKAGLPTTAWRDSASTVLIYEAQVFSEKPKE